MKILTTNFLTCAIKTCKASPASFPLHFKEAELRQQEMDFNPLFIRNILPRVDWDALKITVTELGLTTLPDSKPSFSSFKFEEDDAAREDQDTPMDDTSGKEGEGDIQNDNINRPERAAQQQQAEPKQRDQEKLLRDLHTILLETYVVEGTLVCGHCGHEYPIKESVANFLLPSHLVMLARTIQSVSEAD